MRMASQLQLVVVAVCLLACLGNALDTNIVNIKSYTKIDQYGNSTLYRVETASDSGYDNPPLLIRLVGSRHDIGYAYGQLLSAKIEANYQSLLTWLLKGNWLLKDLVETVLDWQWNKYLVKQVPSMYRQEIDGLSAGAKVKGCDMCGQYTTRFIVLANIPSDPKDMLKVILREMDPKTTFQQETKYLDQPHLGLLCSMFAAWGSRTVSGKLFSSRNLDWNPDTGLNINKIVMVTVPNDGGIPSASVGFVGMYGTLAGMSAKGITVHQANLEEDKITFNGFPWSLRLRYIMEYAQDISSARNIWKNTNNTVGYNHMIASGKDATDYVNNGGHSIVALAMETMYQYTAYFHDSDPREADALYAKNGANPVHIGYPLHEALWRTNHGYDPIIRQHFEWSQAPDSWSVRRYMYIYEALQTYANAGVKIGPVEAVNITAIAGDKGHDQPYTCLNNTNGTSILSVVYQPQDLVLYAAWERSKGQTWRPAVCSSYIQFNLTELFKSSPL